MNFGSDHRVRNAFRATLLDEPSSTSVVGTQEIDAADVLEVTDLANAIARAEEVLRARSSVALPDSSTGPGANDLDIFDSLLSPPVHAAPAPVTDDAVGPAVHAPYIPTPLPPRVASVPLPPGITGHATLLRSPEPMLTPIPAPSAPPSSSFQPQAPQAHAPQAQAPNIPPAPRTAPILILDEDAFYHPAGRIRTLAEQTLDGYRPEPTFLLRVRERRSTLSWVVLLVLAPLVLVVLFAVAVALGRSQAAPAETAQTPASTTTIATATMTAAPPPKAEPPPPAVAAPTAPAVPVLDVNSLKSAKPLNATGGTGVAKKSRR